MATEVNVPISWKNWTGALARAVVSRSYAFAVVYPCRYCASTFKRWTGQKEYPKIAMGTPPGKKAAPAPLPLARERSLSISQDLTELRRSVRGMVTSPFRRKKIADQSQCMLFTRLPPEIRMQIWELVVGNQRLHIIPSLVPSLTRPNKNTLTDNGVLYRLDYETCRKSQFMLSQEMVKDIDSHYTCAIWVNSNGELYFNTPQAVMRGDHGYRREELRFLRWWVRKNRLLSLLKTCRQIYSEAMPILYTSNTFDFRNLDTLTYFQTTILPHRFQSIRFLTIRWHFMGSSTLTDADRWKKACAVISSMQNLRHAVFLLRDSRLRQEYVMQNWLLEPLMGIRVDESFVVRVNWRENRWEEEKRAELPFKIVRDIS